MIEGGVKIPDPVDPAAVGHFELFVQNGIPIHEENLLYVMLLLYCFRGRDSFDYVQNLSDFVA